MAGRDAQRKALEIDLVDERARLGDVDLKLTRRAFEVLSFLYTHPDRLVTKDELFARVWHGTAVSESALTTVIREIRRALGEGSREAHYIQTVHGRGYRFVGPRPAPASAGTPPGSAARSIVGRDAELAICRHWLRACEARARQIGFVAGEPGIGKTALVEAFVESLSSDPRVRIASGQCIELYGAAEPYLPWLDALAALARRVDGAQVIDVLRRVAPLWLAQLPAFVSAAERRSLLEEAADASPQRMFRELADALVLLAAERPLVIVLEDLHWGDRPSLELLAWIARRRDQARLLVIGTYRPRELSEHDHPLRAIPQELLAQRRAEIISLRFLSASAVGDFIEARLPGLPADLADLIHCRTEGNPLFVVNTLEHLQRHDLIALRDGRWEIAADFGEIETAVPDSLRALIESQLDRLSEDARRLLEVASVAGVEFSDAALAPALDTTPEAVCADCMALTRYSGFIAAVGEADWPDGTATRRFAFRHALYAEVLYSNVPPSRRVRIHLAIAERLEAAHGDSRDAIAAELATHFERGRDRGRAVVYLAASARNASRRQAFEEAIGTLRHALDLLESLPASAERHRRELGLRMALAPTLMITRGYAAPEAEREYARAETLSRLGAEDREIFSVLLGRSGPALLMARTTLATDLAEEALELARRRNALRYLAHAESSVGITSFWEGRLEYAVGHLEAGRDAYLAIDDMPANAWLAHDPCAAGLAYAAWAYWLLGRPDRARDQSREAIALARRLHHPFSLAFALAFGAFVHQARRDVPATLAHAEATIETCAEHGFAMYHAVGTIFSGWGRARRGDFDRGIQIMEAGLDAYHATGANLVQPYFRALIAETYLEVDEIDRARALLDHALAHAEQTGERVYLAELHRLRALADWRESILTGASHRSIDFVESRLRRALDIARAQSATGLELRVAACLARVLNETNRRQEAHALLTEPRSRITEGHDTLDWLESTALLDALAGELSDRCAMKPVRDSS